MSPALDVATLQALRDSVHVQEGASVCRVYMGGEQVARYVGCGNQRANALMADLRNAFEALIAKA